MEKKNLGISKEQLLNAISLVKEYVDNLSLETTLPENLKIINESIQSLQPLQYLGTDINNQLGLHYFPQNFATKTGLNQIVTLSTKIGSIININVDGNTEKFLIQVYKYIPGDNDIVEIVKEFNNTDKDNFIYTDNINYTNLSCKIKDLFYINSKFKNNLYFSDEFDPSEFINLIKIQEEE